MSWVFFKDSPNPYPRPLYIMNQHVTHKTGNWYFRRYRFLRKYNPAAFSLSRIFFTNATFVTEIQIWKDLNILYCYEFIPLHILTRSVPSFRFYAQLWKPKYMQNSWHLKIHGLKSHEKVRENCKNLKSHGIWKRFSKVMECC